MILKGFPQAPWSQRLQPVDFPNIKDQAYAAPIRDTIAFRKGGKVSKAKPKKGSAEMKARMASLRKMKK
jgi:hypothetical protein